jgi:hypothetical protein
VSFSGQSDPSDTAARFHYKYALSASELDGATYANSGADESASFDLDAGTYTVYARIIEKDGGYTQLSTTVTVNKANATIVVSGYTGVYDGNAHGATGGATGVKGESLAGLDLGQSFTNVPGGTAHWTFTDATGNDNDAGGTVTGQITAPDTASVGAVGGTPSAAGTDNAEKIEVEANCDGTATAKTNGKGADVGYEERPPGVSGIAVDGVGGGDVNVQTNEE